MHIETLKVFCDIVETGSFSTAAAQNFITQSAVSQQLRALEAKYHCRLLERSRGGARPTAAGEILYRAGREIIDRYQAVDTELKRSGKVVAGHLRVAIVYSVGLHELPPYLKEYLRTFPKVNAHIEYERSNAIYEKVLNGRTDLGIVAYPQKHPQILITSFREDALILVCPSQHILAAHDEVSVGELEGEKLIGFSRDIPTRKATDQMLRAHHVAVRYVGEYDNIETIKRAVEIGQGIALVPAPSVANEIARRTVHAIRLSDETLRRPLGIIHRRGRNLSPAALKFIETLQREDIA